MKNSDGSQKIVNFLNNTLLKNPDSYGLVQDQNNKQPSKLELLPFPGTNNYPIFGYGSIHSSDDINNFISAYQGIQTDDVDPTINDALQYIDSNRGDSFFQAALIFGSDGTYVSQAINAAETLKNAGYLVITIAQTASADVFRPLASGDQYALQIGTGNDDAVAAQIASLLLQASFTCFDDGRTTKKSCRPATSTTMGSTVSQICPNQQMVFKGQVGVIFELLPSSATTQQAIINDFVENLLLNSNFYGLAVDNLTGENMTLVTALPYPRTSEYNPLGYGSARSQADFKVQVDAYNAGVLPVSPVGDLSDALLYVTTVLPAGSVPSALIIVGNSQSLLDSFAPLLAAELQSTFSIFTVSVGSNAVDLSSLATDPGYAFTGNTQQTADQIAKKLESSSPAVYCPSSASL